MVGPLVPADPLVLGFLAVFAVVLEMYDIKVTITRECIRIELTQRD